MEISTAGGKCTGCRYCQATCPVEAISIQIEENTQPVINPEKCTSCGECLKTCPNNVFSIQTIRFIPVGVKHQNDAIVIGAGSVG